MRKSLLATAAVVALITTPALAAEQGKKEAPTPAPAAQQHAPAEKMAPKGTIAPKAENKAAPRRETTGEGAKPEGSMKAGEMPKASETKKANEPAKMNSSQAQPKSAPKAAETQKSNDQKASDAAKASGQKTNESATNNNAAKNQTTGQAASGAAGASVKLTTEQKTKIRTTVIESKSAPRVSRSSIHFNISVGTVVPRDRVHYVAVTPTLISIHPEWRGHYYFVVDEEIIIVDSRGRIVAIVEV